MITEDFKKELIKGMNRGGWGEENFAEVIPLINNHISEQLRISGVSQRSEPLCEHKWVELEGNREGCEKCSMIQGVFN